MKVIVNKLDISEQNQDGSPRIDKNGKPYKMAFLDFTGPTGDRKASMFIGEQYGQKNLEVISQWAIGQHVEITLEQKGDYLNFKLPTATDRRFEAIEARLSECERALGVQGAVELQKPAESHTEASTASLDSGQEPVDEVDVNAIPF